MNKDSDFFFFPIQSAAGGGEKWNLILTESLMVLEHVGMFCSYPEAAAAHTWDCSLSALAQFPVSTDLQTGKDLQGSVTPIPSSAEITEVQGQVAAVSRGHQQETSPLSHASFNLLNSLQRKELLFFPVAEEETKVQKSHTAGE